MIGQIMPVNPASAVRGPRHIVRRGKTPALDPAEARQLIDAIDISTAIGLRDRALIGLMVYSFARIGAAIGMRVEDVFPQNRRLWVRLHEKSGKQHAMPCHHNLESYLHHISTARPPRTIRRRFCSRPTTERPGQLTGTPLPQPNAYAMIQGGPRRGRHHDPRSAMTRSGRQGVTAYLKNGGTLEGPRKWRTMLQHAHHAAL